MALTQRVTAQHTYGDYLASPDNVAYELIDGIAHRCSSVIPSTSMSVESAVPPTGSSTYYRPPHAPTP